MCVSVIRHVLEYACPVWHTNLNRHLTESIETVPKRALKRIYPGNEYADILCLKPNRPHILICRVQPESSYRYLSCFARAYGKMTETCVKKELFETIRQSAPLTLPAMFTGNFAINSIEEC